MVGAEDGGVPCEVVEAVHDDGDDDVEHDEGAEEDEGDEVGDGEVVAARLLEGDAGGDVVGDGLRVAGPTLQAGVHYLGPRLSRRRPGRRRRRKRKRVRRGGSSAALASQISPHCGGPSGHEQSSRQPCSVW